MIIDVFRLRWKQKKKRITTADFEGAMFNFGKSTLYIVGEVPKIGDDLRMDWKINSGKCVFGLNVNFCLKESREKKKKITGIFCLSW